MKQLNNETVNKKVFCMMSGGVDSSVAAALLVQQGYDVVGVFMKNWSPSSIQSLTDCPWQQDLADAEAVCRKLKIPFQSVNFEKEYRAKVVDYFLAEYRAGRTPNPDVVCNREIKFGIFLNWARSQGADFVASGHYARVRANGRWPVQQYQLYRGIDTNKDQSYFLWTLTQDQLPYCLFPVGELKKSEVRRIAQNLNLPTAKKKDSQGICFIGAINVGQLLRSEIAVKSGKVIGPADKVVGEHDGVIYYTIGQRHGFRLSESRQIAKSFRGGDISPLFVVAKDLKKNLLYVGPTDDPRLFSKEIIARNVNWIMRQPAASSQQPAASSQISAQIRYRQSPVRCQIIESPPDIVIKFQKSVCAAAPGQSIVFYDQDLVVGGAIIEKTRFLTNAVLL